MKRPVLTFPPLVADVVKYYYGCAKQILEYGSGGSTVLASELVDKDIVSVESDQDWAVKLRLYIDSNSETKSLPTILHSDIGPTGEWGYPSDRRQWRKYGSYSMLPWIRFDALSPDVILIDGRFRAACFLASAYKIKKQTLFLFDDFVGRKERFLEFTSLVSESYEMVDRMAIFKIDPFSVDCNHAFALARASFDSR